MELEIVKKIQTYQLTVVFSVLFALVGFSYNVWRLEVSEQNNTKRMASFELLKELASLEQLIYTAHYDKDLEEGSPRKGWVKIGIVSDLARLTSTGVSVNTQQLQQRWAEGWSSIDTDRETVDALVDAIDDSRQTIRQLLVSLD